MKNPMACTHCHWIGDIFKCKQERHEGMLADVYECPRCGEIVEPVETVVNMPVISECLSECKCETVKRQCKLCGRKFIPADTVPDLFEQAMEARGAQVSIVGNLLIAVMPAEGSS